MRLPKQAPSLMDLFPKFRESIGEIYETVESPLYKGKYLHWDDILHKTPPGDLSSEAFWLGMKMRRDPLRQQIPLLDKNGRPFSFLQPDPLPERLHRIDLSAGGHIEAQPSQITNPETKDRYYLSSLIEEALSSSQIEGAVATREVAKELIRSGKKPRDRSEQMVLNNYVTMKRINELKDEPLTPDMLLEIHRLITDKTLEDASSAGRFRRSDERIEVGDEVSGATYHIPPHADELRERVQFMCDFGNGKIPDRFIHPALRAAVLHFWLAYDHPFKDGNGRTARALFYWSMLRSKYWLFEFISISHVIARSRQRYYKAFLYTERDDNDLTYFLLYHMEVIERAITALHEYIQRKSAEVRALEHELKAFRRFNHRQLALLSHALRHPYHRYTFESHRRSHNVVRQTARTDLLELKKAGLLNTQKERGRWAFYPALDIHERLKVLS